MGTHVIEILGSDSEAPRLQGCYAHKDAEALFAGAGVHPPDIVHCRTPIEAVSVGIHLADVMGHTALLFRWASKSGQPRGLVVLASDGKGVEDAAQAFYERREFL